MDDWYRQWFGEEYLAMYPHRDGADAEHLTDLIDSCVHLDGAAVLDLACGPGRHAASLSRRGADVTGLDLSEALLRVARSGVNREAARYVRANMLAIPFDRGSFDGVANLFTSFGYFPTDDLHQLVITSVAEVLRDNGWFVMDFLNAAHVVDNLVEEETKKLGGKDVRISRSLVDSGRFVEKRMHVLEDDREHLERVRLLTPGELRAMFEHAGFRVECEFGDYSGGPLTDSTPRTILIGRK